MTRTRERMIDLRSGGWVLLLAIVLIGAVIAWRGPVLWDLATRGRDWEGDRPNGFDLSSATVPRDRIVEAGIGRNAIPSLTPEGVMTVAETAVFNHDHRGNYLIGSDVVIGVTIGGVSRAYPLRVLNWHEIVNDTVNGVPIAVTYHPLCGSVAVFERSIDGRVAEFGVSGLLYNSNLLFFDRSEPEGHESLWSQLLGRAISGDAAHRELELKRISASLATWEHWTASRPKTTVVRPADTYRERYRRNPYGNYLQTGRPRFPVNPSPPDGSLPLMTPLIAVGTGDTLAAYALAGAGLETIRRDLVDADVRLPTPGSGDPISIVLDPQSETPTTFSLWFAWYAAYPETDRWSF